MTRSIDELFPACQIHANKEVVQGYDVSADHRFNPHLANSIRREEAIRSMEKQKKAVQEANDKRRAKEKSRSKRGGIILITLVILTLIKFFN